MSELGRPAPAGAGLRLPPRLLLITSVLYLAVVFGFMLWRGIEIEPQWVVLALMLIAVAMGRGTQFVKDWAPFLVLFFAYEVMRGFAYSPGVRAHDVSGLEKALFDGGLPTIWLQQHFYSPHAIAWYDWAGMFFYFMHFVVPVVVGFVFWTRSRELYWRYISALLAMSFIAFITYLAYPTTPPWMEYKDLIHKVNNETVIKWGVGYYVSPIYSHLNPNPVAAFPSLHAAFPALAAMYAWSRFRWLAVGLLAWTACVWLAIVYLGEHYFVDALAGLLYAAVAALGVEAVSRRLRPPKPASR